MKRKDRDTRLQPQKIKCRGSWIYLGGSFILQVDYSIILQTSKLCWDATISPCGIQFEFKDKLPDEVKQKFKSVIVEGKLVARTTFLVGLDAADSAS